MAGFWETDPNVVLPSCPPHCLDHGRSCSPAPDRVTDFNPAAGSEPAAGPGPKAGPEPATIKKKKHSFYPKPHRHSRNFESPELSSSVVSPTFSPTLNSSACDCGRSELCFPSPFLFYDRSLHEAENRRRLSCALSAGGEGRVAASPCTCPCTCPCPCSFQNRTLHSVGAAQLLSLCLNGPLMTTTFCSTRRGRGGSEELGGRRRRVLDFFFFFFLKRRMAA